MRLVLCPACCATIVVAVALLAVLEVLLVAVAVAVAGAGAGAGVGARRNTPYLSRGLANPTSVPASADEQMSLLSRASRFKGADAGRGRGNHHQPTR